MKLYIVDLDMTALDLEKIKKKIQTKQNKAVMREIVVNRIYSEKGIIEIDKNGKLWNIEIQDDMEPYVYKLDDQIRLYIDRSTMKRKDEAFQIVPEHVFIGMNKLICSLSPNAMVQLVFEMVDDCIKDVYFETEIDIQQHSVREDIVTFLALLNFIESI